MPSHKVDVRLIPIAEEGSEEPNIWIDLDTTSNVYCVLDGRKEEFPSFHLSKESTAAALQDRAAVHRYILDMLCAAGLHPSKVAQSTPKIACAIRYGVEQAMSKGWSAKFLIRLDEFCPVPFHQYEEFARRMCSKGMKYSSSSLSSLLGSPATVSSPSVEALSSPSVEALFALFRKHDAEGSIPQCTICLSNLGGEKKMTWLPCSHIFHASCIAGWLEENNSCPLYRFNNIDKDAISDCSLGWVSSSSFNSRFCM